MKISEHRRELPPRTARGLEVVDPGGENSGWVGALGGAMATGKKHDDNMSLVKIGGGGKAPFSK